MYQKVSEAVRVICFICKSQVERSENYWMGKTNLTVYKLEK